MFYDKLESVKLSLSSYFFCILRYHWIFQPIYLVPFLYLEGQARKFVCLFPSILEETKELSFLFRCFAVFLEIINKGGKV